MSLIALALSRSITNLTQRYTLVMIRMASDCTEYEQSSSGHACRLRAIRYIRRTQDVDEKLRPRNGGAFEAERCCDCSVVVDGQPLHQPRWSNAWVHCAADVVHSHTHADLQQTITRTRLQAERAQSAPSCEVSTVIAHCNSSSVHLPP